MRTSVPGSVRDNAQHDWLQHFKRFEIARNHEGMVQLVNFPDLAPSATITRLFPPRRATATRSMREKGPQSRSESYTKLNVCAPTQKM